MEVTATEKPLWTDTHMHMPIIGGFNAVAPSHSHRWFLLWDRQFHGTSASLEMDGTS